MVRITAMLRFFMSNFAIFRFKSLENLKVNFLSLFSESQAFPRDSKI